MMEATLGLSELSQSPPQPSGPDTHNAFKTAWTRLQLFFDPLRTVAQRFDHYGDAYRVQYPSGALYVLRHPDHIRDVLVSNAAAFDKQHSAFRLLSRVLGEGLLTTDGELWRRQRRMVQPAFARSRLEQYSAVMVDEAERCRARLTHLDHADLSREMNALTLRIVTRTLFGQRSADSGQTARAMQDLNTMLTTPPQWFAIWPGARRRFERSVAQLDAIVDGLIEAKRRELSIANSEGSDLLSALMLARDEEHGDALTARELRDQLLTLYLAGHETTSHALTWTLYLLSQHPRALTALQAELQSVLGGRPPTFDGLPALKYTEQVLKEGLRLYPPAFTLPRHACMDTSIGPYPVAKGSEVVIWIYHVHRNPRFYPEPERFDPDRFTQEQEAARPKYAYLPFGAGQRACIGQMFAMLEAQLILATLLQNLRFDYARKRPPGIRMGVTLAPRGGMPMRVTALPH